MQAEEIAVSQLRDLYNHNCTLCPLHQGAKTVCVPGRGAEQDVKILIVGEAPGGDEDERGLPFVGRAGQLLEGLLQQAQIEMPRVRFENIARCVPRNTLRKLRAPEEDEIEACIPYLYRVIDQLVREGSTPIIVALGNTALKALTGFSQVTRNRGRFLFLKPPAEFAHLANLTVMGTIHPAAVLRGQENYRKLILTDLAKAWRRATGQASATLEYWKDYWWVEDIEAYREWVHTTIERYEKGEIPWISYDMETTGFSPYDSNQRVVCLSLCATPGKALIVPFYHKDSPWKDNPSGIEEVRKLSALLLEKVPICGWNLSFDLKWTKLHLQVYPTVKHDGFLASKWIYGVLRPSHELNFLVQEELGFEGHGDAIKAEMSAIKDPAQRHYGNSTKETMIAYSGGDADGSLQLCTKTYEMMAKADILPKFDYIQTRALPRLVQMELNGVKVSKDMNRYLQTEYLKMMKPLEDKVLYSKWGQQTSSFLATRVDEDGEAAALDFNLKSVDTARHLLFTAMGLPPGEMRKTGPSTDGDAIDELIELCAKNNWLEQMEVLKAIREWKLLRHNYNNFIKNADKYLWDDGLFHTQYNIAGAATGRLSTYQPSLHGTPKGSMVRWQFVSRWERQGGLIVSGDASQMELRVLAVLSQDPNLIETIKSGQDLHSVNASKMFKVPFEEIAAGGPVAKAMRQKAKTAGFAVVYGATAETVASQIDSTREEAQRIIDSWYAAYPKTRDFQNMEWAMAKRYGHTYTPFGRMRWIENIQNEKAGSHAWRQSINTAIQSVASDLTLTALMEVFDEIEKRGLKSKMFGFIHDAIVSDVYPGELWDILAIKHEKMESWLNASFPWVSVPLVASFDVCPGWGYPCEVTEFDEQKIALEGSLANMVLLQAEVSHLPGVTYQEVSRKEDEKTHHVTVSGLLQRNV